MIKEGTEVLSDESAAVGSSQDAAQQPADGSAGLSAGAIVGIAVGGVAAGLLAALAALAVRRRRNRRQQGTLGASPGGKPRGLLLPFADKRAASGVDACALEPGGPPGQPLTSPAADAAVAQAPQAPGLGTPRQRRSADGSTGDNLRAASISRASPSSPTAAVLAAKAPALAWAAELLEAQAPSWQDALVPESEITFEAGPDGQPITLGRWGLVAAFG